MDGLKTCKWAPELGRDKPVTIWDLATEWSIDLPINTLRTGDADLGFYITTVQDG